MGKRMVKNRKIHGDAMRIDDIKRQMKGELNKAPRVGGTDMP
jgi:hypothetical protein